MRCAGSLSPNGRRGRAAEGARLLSGYRGSTSIEGERRVLRAFRGRSGSSSSRPSATVSSSIAAVAAVVRWSPLGGWGGGSRIPPSGAESRLRCAGSLSPNWRRGRAAEGARLLSGYWGSTSIEGSNPSVSVLSGAVGRLEMSLLPAVVRIFDCIEGARRVLRVVRGGLVCRGVESGCARLEQQRRGRRELRFVRADAVSVDCVSPHRAT